MKLFKDFKVNNYFLVLTHKPINHIYRYAELYPNAYFYIHVDKKSDMHKIKKEHTPSNIIFVADEHRVDITWAGFSMVQATINLIECALKDQKTDTGMYHLISGDDVILKDLNTITADENQIYMEYIDSPRHRYRTRFNTPHADTKHQRKIYGKALTIFYKFLDKLIPSKERCIFGSQWFSISTQHLQILMNNLDQEFIEYYRYKLCPDEHFFQYLVKKSNLENYLSPYSNMRHIIFDPSYQHGSSPIFLDLKALNVLKNKDKWFARKVQFDVIDEFLADKAE